MQSLGIMIKFYNYLKYIFKKKTKAYFIGLIIHNLISQQNLMEKYKTLSTLGDGAFGTVYKAINIKTDELVAIKKMKQKYKCWDECIELREIKSLRKLNHPNVIKLKEVLLVSDELYMVFEYLEYNLYEVYSRMKEKNTKFTEKEIKSIIYQIVEGLAHMHKNGFFHRDMKPQNLLIYNNVVKLCDMGLAREIRSRPPFTDYVSTRWYRSPELLLRSTSYNSPVDIFALGCIMVELYNLVPLFAGNNQVDQLNKIVKIMGTPDKTDWPEGYKLAQTKGYYFPQQIGINFADLIPDASPEGVDLIQSMLRYSSRKRPTAAQILRHQYFKDVSLPSNLMPGSKQIIFNEKPSGQKLDTKNEDKKIDQFRKTKQKFKETRKHDAMQGNPFKMVEKENEMADLDSLIEELEKKGKRKESQKLPQINTRNNFHQRDDKQRGLRESKTQMKHGQPYKFGEKDLWKNINKKQITVNLTKEQNLNKNKQSLTKPPSKSEPFNNKFSYSFQPTLNPAYQNMKNSNTNSVKTMNHGLGYRPLQSIKSELKPLNPYKY